MVKDMIEAPASTAGEDWSLPPKGKDKQPITVNLRIDLVSLSDIDTVKNMLQVKFYYIMYWTDPRLANWEGDLPDKLWGPCLSLCNLVGEKSESSAVFALVDAATGRLKRVREVCAFVTHKMHLLDFPFDAETFVAKFSTTSTWLTKDESNGGEIPFGKDYSLRQVTSSGAEGFWLDPWWNGDVSEWTAHGVSSKINEKPPAAAGYEQTEVVLRYHTSRMIGYYIWKVMMPIYTLIFLASSAFDFEVKDIANRQSILGTYFLANFGMLYVISEMLPRTSYLTRMDKLIVCTLVFLLGACLEVRVAFYMEDYYERPEVAKMIDRYAVCSLVCLYVLANLFIMLPGYYYQKKFVRTHSASCMLEDGFAYYTFPDLNRHDHTVFQMSSECAQAENGYAPLAAME